MSQCEQLHACLCRLKHAMQTTDKNFTILSCTGSMKPPQMIRMSLKVRDFKAQMLTLQTDTWFDLWPSNMG